MDHHPTPTTTTTTTQTQNQTQSEAVRLLNIASKLLQTRDLTGSREFALLAQETEPLLEQSDQIIAITDVLLASEKRVNNSRQQLDYYSILQTDRRSEPDLIRKSYRRLALLLHPDKNRFTHSDVAFDLVADAWSVLSDPSKRASYDAGLGSTGSEKLPVRRSSVNFWTTCPYCYVIYEFPRVYIDCCIRCDNCDRGFHAAAIPSLPPLVPGKEAYYCCWGFFPLGFETGTINDNDTDNNAENPSNAGFPNWMPGNFTPPVVSGAPGLNKMGAVRGVVDFSAGFGNAVPSMSVPGSKKRGRPRKNL
ncbi:uncharacterized protein LOC141604818 [Silene latifolia]|uniref:uncharacterized protein LOC141604818 n=1 Tax=Silene latifolia TaxID=37657 RepID=UPI003D772D0E